jgi:hypothetical protein
VGQGRVIYRMKYEVGENKMMGKRGISAYTFDLMPSEFIFQLSSFVIVGQK